MGGWEAPDGRVGGGGWGRGGSTEPPPVWGGPPQALPPRLPPHLPPHLPPTSPDGYPPHPRWLPPPPIWRPPYNIRPYSVGGSVARDPPHPPLPQVVQYGSPPEHQNRAKRALRIDPKPPIWAYPPRVPKPAPGAPKPPETARNRPKHAKTAKSSDSGAPLPL